jgi:hypothetical protein
VVAALSCALPVIAHHSFSAEFDSGKTVTLRGVVSKVDVTANPAKDGTQAYGFMTKLSYQDGHVFSMSPQDADPGLRKTQK